MSSNILKCESWLIPTLTGICTLYRSVCVYIHIYIYTHTYTPLYIRCIYILYTENAVLYLTVEVHKRIVKLHSVALEMNKPFYDISQASSVHFPLKKTFQLQLIFLLIRYLTHCLISKNRCSLFFNCSSLSTNLHETIFKGSTYTWYLFIILFAIFPLENSKKKA